MPTLPIDFQSIFADSFDTFKIFQNIDPEKASLTSGNTPKSVWQILNHLIVWQQSQLDRLNGVEGEELSESQSWKEESKVNDDALLHQRVRLFHRQIEDVKAHITNLSVGPSLQENLKIIQELSVHLSFHLGEMVLLLRQNGHYPMPGEMKAFLCDNS